MRVYWEQRRKGQRLVLQDDQTNFQEEVGGVRQTKNGFDAFAKTFGYEPGRAMKGMPTLGEAKEFVESFSPWELFQGGQGITVDPEVRGQDG